MHKRDLVKQRGSSWRLHKHYRVRRCFMDVNQIVAIAVFVIVMLAIMTEKLHRSLAAITGAMLVLALHVMPFDAAMEHIDFNTLGVLLGMMLFVSVVKLSGVFEFLAIKCARLAKGDPWKIMLLFVLLTAVLSAFLDNVTTVLLIGPMTLTVCKLLDINPIPFFMTEILASNIGGTATLIGDPPNIMIGSAAGYSFFDFILYDAPAVVIILAAVLVVFYFMYGRKMHVDDEHRSRIMELDEHAQIKESTPAQAERGHDGARGGGLHGARRAGARVVHHRARRRRHHHAHLGREHRGSAVERGVDHAVVLRRPVRHRGRAGRDGRHRHVGERVDRHDRGQRVHHRCWCCSSARP